MSKLLDIVYIVILVIAFYVLGAITGYTIGYNDNYAEQVVKYRTAKRGG